MTRWRCKIISTLNYTACTEIGYTCVTRSFNKVTGTADEAVCQVETVLCGAGGGFSVVFRAALRAPTSASSTHTILAAFLSPSDSLRAPAILKTFLRARYRALWSLGVYGHEGDEDVAMFCCGDM